MSYWQHWKYKHLTFVILSVVIVTFLSKLEIFHQIILQLGNYGYIGTFFAGMLFVSTYTVTIGAYILFVLAEKLNPIEIAIIAGLGAVVGDFTIFKFIKDDLLGELKDIYDKFGGKNLNHLLHTRYFGWSLPVIGALIIASPLPDELGVGLMGITRMNTYEFLIISFFLNSLGIFLVVTSSVVLKL